MKILLISLLLSRVVVGFSQIPTPSNGVIKHYKNFSSKFVTPRNVDVWLPDNYTANKRYAVLYMHDGKGLYDSTIMWNRQEWGMDEVMSTLIQEQKIEDCIVVGIWNSEGTRHTDYFPQKPFETLTKNQQDSILNSYRNNGQPVFSEKEIKSDNYLNFIVKELKPFIDRAYSTHKNSKNTFMAGSSMGALISIYAICEYPKVFGGVACLSTHWPGIFSIENNPIPASLYSYLKSNLPKPKTHKIYFDYGDRTLDAMYPPLQKNVDSVMKAKGFKPDNWITKYFQGEDHSEKAWSKRLHIPLEFLLKEKAK